MYRYYNMVEKSFDKINITPNKWALKGYEAWLFMNHKFGLLDLNAMFIMKQFTEYIWYMWTNLQFGHARILKHLDCIMLSNHQEFFFS